MTEKKPRKSPVRRPLHVLVRLLDLDGNPVTNVAEALVIEHSRDGRFAFQPDATLVVLTLEN